MLMQLPTPAPGAIEAWLLPAVAVLSIAALVKKVFPRKRSDDEFVSKTELHHELNTVRDKLNVMLLDGVPYAEIIKALGSPAEHITEHNITTWVAAGHKEWLEEQFRLEETRVKQEVAMDLACPEGGSKIHEATLQLAATRLSEMVRKLDYTDFRELLRDDPAKLTPFLAALATISNAELRCERHRLELDERRAKLEKNYHSAKPAGLSTEARQEMEQQLKLK